MQRTPQSPQLFESLWTLTHVPLQLTLPPEQPHTAPEQIWPWPHWLPQVPQLLLSRLMLTHVPLQGAKPLGQLVQLPSTQ